MKNNSNENFIQIFDLSLNDWVDLTNINGVNVINAHYFKNYFFDQVKYWKPLKNHLKKDIITINQTVRFDNLHYNITPIEYAILMNNKKLIFYLLKNFSLILYRKNFRFSIFHLIFTVIQKQKLLNKVINYLFKYYQIKYHHFYDYSAGQLPPLFGIITHDGKTIISLPVYLIKKITSIININQRYFNYDNLTLLEYELHNNYFISPQLIKCLITKWNLKIKLIFIQQYRDKSFNFYDQAIFNLLIVYFKIQKIKKYIKHNFNSYLFWFSKRNTILFFSFCFKK